MTFPKAGVLFYNQIVPFTRSLSIMLSSTRFLIGGVGMLLMAALLVRADDEDDRHMGNALNVAKEWIAEIDAGEYDQSYADGGSALHEKVPQDTWVRILKTERPLLGNVVTRTETDHSYRPNGFEGTDGEFFVISYRTAFANKPDEVEHLVLKREGGRWRGVGYDFGPEEVTTDPDAGPTTTVTTSTNAPPVPSNGITVPVKRPGN
jgi:hypothetical protein